MSYFSNICLLKSPQSFDVPHPQDISDLTEVCNLAAMVENDVDSLSIPVDFYSKKPYETFIKFLKKNPVDIVAISTMTGAFNNALKLAKISKRYDKYVLMGGYHPTALPEDVLKSEYVDAVIIGEGEETFKDFVINGPSKKVQGLAFKENGNVVRTEPRPLIKDIDSLPLPLRRTRPERFGEPGDDYSIDTIYTSRGCPWKCTFCANDTINKSWRARSPENVLEEIAMLHNPKRKKLLKFWDANFLTDVNRIEKICDLMLENKLTNFKIWTETRVDDIVRAENIMGKLYKVGLRHVSLGIESPNSETLKLMKKKNTPDACAKAIKILNGNLIKPQGYFIIGHYAETVEDTKRYPEFASKLGLRHSVFMVMTPYPGTSIFDEYKKEKKIKSFNWDLYNNFQFVVETRGMNLKELKKMYAYCFGRFYSEYSFLSQKKTFAMLIPLLQVMFLLYNIFKRDKSNSKEEVKDYLFEYLEAGCVTFNRPYPMRPPLFLRWFKEVVIRFRHSPGKNVDFHITQFKDSRRLTGKKTDDTGLVKGITIDLDKIIEFSEKISPERFVSIVCKFDVLKNNPERRFRNLFSFCFDMDVVIAILSISGYFTSVLVKGIVSILVSHLIFPYSPSLKKEHHEAR